MLIKTNNKWEALHAFINTWLKDPTVYCNVCNADYKPHLGPCCDSPELGTNLDITRAVVTQNREYTKSRMNSYAANKDNTMRWGISMPPRLYQSANMYFKNHGYPKGLFGDNKDLKAFMKKFRAFRIAEKV